MPDPSAGRTAVEAVRRAQLVEGDDRSGIGACHRSVLLLEGIRAHQQLVQASRLRVAHG